MIPLFVAFSLAQSPIVVHTVNTFGDWFRVVNMILSTIALLLMVWRLRVAWRRYSFAQKMIIAAVALYNVSIFFRAYQLLVGKEPFYIWQAVTFCGTLCLLVFLFEPKGNYQRRFGDDMISGKPPTAV